MFVLCIVIGVFAKELNSLDASEIAFSILQQLPDVTELSKDTLQVIVSPFVPHYHPLTFFPSDAQPHSSFVHEHYLFAIFILAFYFAQCSEHVGSVPSVS